MGNYIDRIALATDLEELNNIVEDAADDTWITDEDYCKVYSMCVSKVQSWT